MTDRAELRERVVADELGLLAADVVEGDGQVAGVPGEDRVGDDLEAEGVASVIVFVGGELLALTERDVSAQRVHRLALVELRADAAS
ncbi:MAG: hypothetical protein M3417_11775 [Actinomycetota bacterium]|nr:hypothetical protein [Actinomycetota bacterium]